MDFETLVSAPVARARAAVVDRLHPEWSNILKCSWSLRINAIAFILSGLEVALPLFEADPPIPLKWFAPLLGLTTGGAFIARLYAQKNMGASQ